MSSFRPAVTPPSTSVYPHPVHPAAAPPTAFRPNPPRSSSLAGAASSQRTASLLPPARIAGDPAAPHAAAPLDTDLFSNPRPAPKIPDSAREVDSRHKRGHSRSSSLGGLSDTLRNLNRWSASTTSSRASNATTGFARGSPPAAPAPIPPLQSLPRISAGPSLEHEVLESNALRSFSPTKSPPQQDVEPSSKDSGALWDGQSRAPEVEQGLSSHTPGYTTTAVDQRQHSEMIAHEPTMHYTQNGQAIGHSRSRSPGAKGGVDATSSSRSREKERDRDRERERERAGKPPSQKAMLSKALQEANTAVQLDNAQNFEGARRAYSEACKLLQQVLLRTPGEEDRRKLEAIARYNNGSSLRPPADSAYMPPPLSPRRPPSAARASPPPPEQESPRRAVRPAVPESSGRLSRQGASGHLRANSHESISWLDPIDESERSSVTSMHSRSSSRIRRKHIRTASGATEAEFDAALDDAIEAAYDDGYEPESQYVGHTYHDEGGDPLQDTLRRVERARELVRESEREALELANEREKRLRLQQQLEDEEYRRQEAIGEDFYDESNDSEEEERLLEEMTKGNVIEDFTMAGRSRPPVPRESDSSGTTSRTWHSSTASNPPTATTVLTPVSEDRIPPQPSVPLPALPAQAAPQTSPPLTSAGSGQTVRSRRLSGQNPKELKIETTKLAPAAPAAPATAGGTTPSQPKPGSYIVQQRQALSAGANRTLGPFTSRPGPSPIPGIPGEEPDKGPLPPTASSQEEYPRVGTPSVVRPGLRSNYSSSSLKSMKSRNLSISHLDETAADTSPGTPLTTQFSARLPAVPALPPGIKDRANSTTTGGLHLFDNHFHSFETPGTPNPLMPDAPVPLEPCPNEMMLRPFWLMRCMYQTLCHPRGGYISTKLFVPRDAWRVKGVKLKNVEDKIANCDLLTAALQKLGRVDTCDADAVLEEMQSLEGVLEQVQATLARKLGSEVGVQGASAMLKDASAAEADAAAMPRSASVAGKASSFSWRRLRSKNSSANLPGLASAYGGKGGSGGGGGAASTTNLSDGSGGKDASPALASLPMTDHPTSRPPKRDVASVQFTGPNANYMASLARLFDAAQTVDQIARQVEDPGLRHADKTQVGLELCARHAAEFFAFYVCRFALADMMLLLDKFLKRGSEWVLA
ncbi:uncharacterized protein THITE_2038977 [Thermothielavioides terrestris NRRL 8126]|uniref:MIT domain-containing protein n=1 Tax=Thermothielavioides terrestris (strain ATCC 38088 / NRRL 8126) TaxID=578455 RepID=G2QVE6_THETT|nr:uncharacterized protein THITE_2038977 [Thermothielavioides terrestris NRRL 8126]AEO64636.1 hypothetical protein THITE_2038977 [Thermothielavioides terrestris NRRL 8126]